MGYDRLIICIRRIVPQSMRIIIQRADNKSVGKTAIFINVKVQDLATRRCVYGRNLVTVFGGPRTQLRLV